MTRRTMMNSIVALPIAAAVPIASTVMTSSLVDAADCNLHQAADDLAATDLAIAAIFKTFGDDAEDREDYLKLEDQRNDCIAILIEVQATSMRGIQAKAAALRLKTMIDDYDQHQQIAVSRADDLVRPDSQAIC
jgi:hypothetical protein